MREAIILIFANKQDLPEGMYSTTMYKLLLSIPCWGLIGCIICIVRNILISCFAVTYLAMKPHEIQEKLGLTRIRDRNWHVQPACATTGDGLYEGLTWLTSNHKS